MRLRGPSQGQHCPVKHSASACPYHHNLARQSLECTDHDVFSSALHNLDQCWTVPQALIMQ